MALIVLIIILVSALALQLLVGNFPVGFFAFPLNLICLLIWLVLVLWLWNERRKSLLVTFMLSPSATFTSIFLLLAASLVIGFTGRRDLASSWVFVTVLFLFQTVLLFVIFRGWRAATPTGARLGPVRWRFILLHVGLLTAVASAFWGAPDSQTLRLKAVAGVPVTEAVAMDGTPQWLDYEVELKQFDMQTYESGVPSDFSADVFIAGKPVQLKVNHPYTVSFCEQVYLSGYDTAAGPESGYCILQVVREPWKYGTVVGIIMMLAGAFLLFIGGPRKRYNDMD